jgi:hypothetical protein
MDSVALPILLADDGELGDVRALLDELGIEFAEAGERHARPVSVLISNPRRAVARAHGIDPQVGVSCRFHIVVSDKISRTLRRELQLVTHDFLLERPLDPVALRLVLLHGLYSGPERRRSSRVAMSASVRCRAGLVSRAATLAELSERGCRLVTRAALEAGQVLSVVLPRDVTGSRALTVEGRVVGIDPAGGGEPGRHAYAVAFGPLGESARELLRAAMAAGAVASRDLRPRTRALPPEPVEAPEASDEVAAPEPLPPAAEPARRRSERGSYTRSFLATGNSGAHVLIGCDLSIGGMRVNPDATLGVGDELKLVMPTGAGRAPLLLRAAVLRDEGPEGMVLRFENLSPAATADLARLVQTLPDLRPPDPVPYRGPNTVVTEIVAQAGAARGTGSGAPRRTS